VAARVPEHRVVLEAQVAGLRSTWSAVWRSRLLVWLVGAVAFVALGPAASVVPTFDPARLSVSLGSVGNVLAAPSVRWYVLRRSTRTLGMGRSTRRSRRDDADRRLAAARPRAAAVLLWDSERRRSPAGSLVVEAAVSRQPKSARSVLIPAAAVLVAAYMMLRGLGPAATLDAQEKYPDHAVVVPLVGAWEGIVAAWRQLLTCRAGRTRARSSSSSERS
jgi:hypothetical protein